MFEKILFAPGLYLTEDEVTLFSIVWNKDSFPSRKEYRWAFESKLEKSIFKAFEELILEELGEHEMAKLISDFTFGVSTSLGVEDIRAKFQENMLYTFQDDWAMSTQESYAMDLDNPATLVSQLMDHDYLDGMLSDFYDRIEALEKGQSLKAHYLEIEKIEKGDGLGDFGTHHLNYEYHDLIFVNFFRLSTIVKENIN